MFPALKSNIQCSPWKAEFVLFNPKNNAQLLVSSVDKELILKLDGTHSFDEMEELSKEYGPLYFYHLLRKLWHRNFLQRTSEIGAHFFPSEQLLIQKMKRRSVIQFALFQFQWSLPYQKNDLSLHRPFFILLQISLFLLGMGLSFWGNGSFPDNPFAFQKNWFLGSIFAYFGASIALSISSLLQGYFLSTFHPKNRWEISQLFGIIHLSLHEKPIFFAEKQTRRWFSTIAISSFAMVSGIALILGHIYPQLPFSNAGVAAFLIMFWGLCPFYDTPGSQLLETLSLHKQRFRVSTYLENELLGSLFRESQGALSQHRRIIQAWFAWLYFLLVIGQKYLFTHYKALLIHVFSAPTLLEQIWLGVLFSLFSLYLLTFCLQGLKISWLLLKQLKPVQQYNYQDMKNFSVSEPLQKILLNTQLFDTETLPTALETSTARKYPPSATLFDSNASLEHIWFLRTGQVVYLQNNDGVSVEKCVLDAPLLLNYTASRSNDASGQYQLQAKTEAEVILLPSPPIPPIVQERYQQITKHSFFSLLSNKSHFLLALDSQIEYFLADSTILQKGDPSDSIFILLEGEVEVQTTERNILLSAGAIFGEMGFISNSPRNADVKAQTKVGLLRIPSPSLHLCIQLDNSLNESLEELASSRKQA